MKPARADTLVVVGEEPFDRGVPVGGERGVITAPDHIGAAAYEFIFVAHLHLATPLTHLEDEGDQGYEPVLDSNRTLARERSTS
jgi:hypothetical protein